MSFAVANTPAEVTHLLEEIQAKDAQILAFKDEISKRDAQLQKWVRLNGGHVLNPKEDAFSETIKNCYDKCEILQAEKCGLSEKALIVLERQIKRLDVGLRSLGSREEFPSNWDGPSLLSASGTGANTPAGTGPVSSTAGPLQAVSGNIGSTGGMANIANAAQLRMAVAAASARGSGVQTPPVVPRVQREGSTEASNKRRRLNQPALGNLPASSSNLRQSSLGPGTPKAGTPGPASTNSRAGSAQPARPALGQKKAPASAQPSRKPAPSQQSRKRDRPPGGTKKGRDRRSQLARDRATPSTNASLSDEESESTSPTPTSLQRSQADGTADGRRRGEASAEEEDEENDDQLYCYCQKSSFGDMVGCDNDNCEYQWFHWDCVGVKSAPEGEWLCPTCRKLPKGQLVLSKA
nr:chromatin modification-related protein yng2 [Quercus suber]